MKTILATITMAGALLAASASPTVYFTAHGKTYHTNEKCMSLTKSPSVLHSTEAEAIAHGLKLCGICVRRSKSTSAPKAADNTTWAVKGAR